MKQKRVRLFSCVILNFQCDVDVGGDGRTDEDALTTKLSKELTCWINTMFIGHDLEKERRVRD